MNRTTALKNLKSMGTAQNQKVYGRHGVTDKMFGVSYANLGKLKKEIKMDHSLAVALWNTGIHDARILATMIADPQEIDSTTLDTWVKDLNNYIVTDAFSGYVARTSHARKKMEKWIKSKSEWVGRTGYLLMTRLALSDRDLDDEFLKIQMKAFETDLHRRKNRVRDAMNSALIAMGMRSPSMQKQALASARKIGKVDVDHGETGCKTPDAASYMKKATAKRGFLNSRKSKG